MKKYISTFLIGLSFITIFTTSCKEEFLEINPSGGLDENILANEEGIDQLLIGAYAMLDGVADQGFGWEAASSNWVFGSIRGMEANKGANITSESSINSIQNYSESANNPYLNTKWRSLYEGIARANSVILVTQNALEAGNITTERAEIFIQQAKALRGHYHFEAWKMWQDIPYVDETADHATLTNTEDIRANIIADLEEGTSLPKNMEQIGRFNGTVAKVILAKAYMQMFNDYKNAQVLLEDVVATGTKPDGSAIGLEPKYGDIFDINFRNGLEAIYTVQYSVNDGSDGWNGGWGEVLNFPFKSGASPGGCCSFFQPSFDFVNSFRTQNGLPLLDGSYNNDPVLNDQGIAIGDRSYVEDAGPLDPRLDWTVGRRGVPYLDWGNHTGQDWVRDQAYAGPFSPKKQVFRKSQEGRQTETGSWTSGFTANGYRMIRYADVLLLLAECQIETGDLAGALTNINAIRNRAANPEGFVTETDGTTPAANYNIRPYQAFPNQEFARQALQMERKLELGMEGHRFFDLVRWGNAQTEIDRALAHDRPILPQLYSPNASFGPEDVKYPIPQRQIDLSNGNLVQNR